MEDYLLKYLLKKKASTIGLLKKDMQKNMMVELNINGSLKNNSLNTFYNIFKSI